MGKSKLTDLNNIRYFLEAADGGSFSAAARVFGVPPSLVSRRIAQLEREAGARLFQRTTRSLTLTDAGQVFLVHARTGMQFLTLAHESLADSEGELRGRVRLSAPVGAAHMIWSTLSRFMIRHPEVRVEMELEDRYVGLVEERFDLAIRSGSDKLGDKLIGRRLLDSPRVLVANPDYLKSRGTPQHVSELKNHACVILGPRTSRASWQLHIGKRIQNVIVEGRVAVNEAILAAQCAADGFGIAFLPLAVCAKHLDAGRLIRVLPRVSAGKMGLWLVYPNRHLAPASRALAEFLVKELPASVTASAQ